MTNLCSPTKKWGRAMRAVVGSACFVLLLATMAPAAAQGLLSQDAFADAVIAEIRAQAPDYKVRKVGRLHLDLEGPQGEEFQMYLDNAYRIYQSDPGAGPETIATYVASILDAQVISEHVDVSRIVPVIKSVDFLNGMREMAESSGDEPRDFAHEVYNAELVVLFAEDTDLNIRYLSEEHLAEVGFPEAGRRARAVENLMALLPDIEAHGEERIYMLTAGGDYEASLLLFDSIWESGQLSVQGELVAAIPARDVLLITGSQDRAGLEQMRQLVSDVMRGGSYTITDQLFVYQDGRFVPFQN